MNKENILRLKNVVKCYQQASSTVKVLNGINLTLSSGETMSVIGASGSGKSTLLHIVGLLDNPTEGVIEIFGENLHSMSEKRKDNTRLQHLGFVYQQHHLLREFNARENIALPGLIAGQNYKKYLQKADILLEELGLSHRKLGFPAELSGGEQQRVAIARALINEPKLILADEPTGNLDPETSHEVFSLLINFIKKRNAAMILVTHDVKLASKTDRLSILENGVLKIT